MMKEYMVQDVDNTRTHPAFYTRINDPIIPNVIVKGTMYMLMFY